MTILTRKDQVGATAFDSIAWALDVHIKQPDTGIYNYGILHGNEDAPLRIQLWREDPEWTKPCDLDWTPQQQHEQQYFLSKDGKTKYLVSRNFPEEEPSNETTKESE